MGMEFMIGEMVTVIKGITKKMLETGMDNYILIKI